MASKKFMQAALTLAATMSVAVVAGCPSTPTQPTPSGSASATPSGTPSTTPSGTPTSPTSPAPGSDVTPSAAPTSLPSTPDTSSRATIQGIVFDDLGSRLDGVTVTGKVLGAGTFANGSDTLSVTTQIGSYALNGAPTGATILVTATKAGMTTRQQTIVPLSNLQGDTTLNRVSFGETINGNTDRVYPLSDKPEITSFTPAKDATGVDANTTFTLTFNEPVNTADVESNFAVYVAGPKAAMANTPNEAYTLSASNTKLNYTYDPNKDDGAVASTPAAVRISTAPIYDSASFTAAWSNNNQTVTFTFRPGAKLPTDKDASKLPQYAVSFKDGSIRDAAGTGRDGYWFRVSPAQVGRQGYKFTVAADTTAPTLSTITPVNKDDLATGATTDVLRAQFSETMALFPGNLNGASIPTNADVGFVATAANFRYFTSPVGTTSLPDGTSTLTGGFSFSATGSNSAQNGFTPTAAKFYDGDATRATVEMVPLQGSLAGNAVFAAAVTTGSAGGGTIINIPSTANLVVGDLIMTAAAAAAAAPANFGRVTAINSGTQFTIAAVPASGAPINNDNIANWATTVNGAAAIGATSVTLTTTAGLQAGDLLFLNGAQVVRITSVTSGTVVATTPLTAAVGVGNTAVFRSKAFGAGSGYTTGNNVWVMANSTIIDPAANGINTSNNINVRSGIAQ